MEDSFGVGHGPKDVEGKASTGPSLSVGKTWHHDGGPSRAPFFLSTHLPLANCKEVVEH